MTSCFVLGNGPSLAKVDNSVIDELPSFGSNKIFLKYSPYFYACVNPTEAMKYPKDIEKLWCVKKFITEKVEIKGCVPLHSTREVEFSFDPYRYVNEGYSVSFVLLQLAYYFGYRTVFLLGEDHRYVHPGKPNELIKWKGADVNHFDPTYVQDGDKWNAPDLKQSAHYFQIAREVYERNGRRIINLTPDSDLKVFETGTL